MINWISVKDRLPDKNNFQILCCEQREHGLGWFEGFYAYYDQRFMCNGDGCMCCSEDVHDVKYWAEVDLPEMEQK